jgi:hypothetical protein
MFVKVTADPPQRRFIAYQGIGIFPLGHVKKSPRVDAVQTVKAGFVKKNQAGRFFGGAQGREFFDIPVQISDPVKIFLAVFTLVPLEQRNKFFGVFPYYRVCQHKLGIGVVDKGFSGTQVKKNGARPHKRLVINAALYVAGEVFFYFGQQLPFAARPF